MPCNANRALLAALAAWSAWPWPARAQDGVDPAPWVTDGPVYAVARSGDTVYLGGNFTRVGPVTGGGALLSASSGQAVLPLPRVEGRVYAVASDGAGGWYVGGLFTEVGGASRSNLARILADGSVSPWAPPRTGRCTP